MNKNEIMNIIPHRDNMLLIDEAEVRDGVAYGKYKITGEEWFLKGHFPNNPIVPGVVLCEMLAQTVCVLLSDSDAHKGTPYFTGLNNVKFRKKVFPGDTFCSECVIIKSKGPFYFASGKGYTDGEVCVSAEFSFTIGK